MTKPENFSGRTACLTGASGKLGREVCESLAIQGCNLVLVDRPGTELDSFGIELTEKYGIATSARELDLEDEEQRIELTRSPCELTPNVEILINNAAFVGSSELTGWAVPFQQQELATWRRAIEVNLTACFHLCQLFAPFLSMNGKGTIVNIASIYGILGPNMSLYHGTDMGNPAAYGASKGGLIQLTRWLATTLAPGIRVNCISPGGIARNQPEEFASRYRSMVPLGRMALEVDISGPITFLAGEQSQYITGQNLVVDGGLSAW